MLQIYYFCLKDPVNENDRLEKVQSKMLIFVGFFTADNDINKQFKKLADALNEDHRFAHTTNKDILQKYGYSE